MAARAKTKVAAEAPDVAVDPTTLAVAKPRGPRRLLDIAPEFMELMAKIEANGGDLSDDIGQGLEKWLNELGDEIGAKLDGYCHALRFAEQDALAAGAYGDSYSGEAALYYNRQKVCLNTVKRLKERLRDWMTLTEQTSITTLSGRIISVQANGGADTLDEETVDLKDPELKKFITMAPVLNKAELEKAMKAEGANFTRVRFKTKGTHLRIA